MTDDGAIEPDLRSKGYHVALARATCPGCRSQTVVAALALEPGHETREVDAVTADGVWQSAAAGALLFHVEYLSGAVQCRLRELAPHYRPAAAPRADGTRDDGAPAGGCWVNHCERCGAQLADDDLHCEPGAAFMPLDAAGAAAIELIACPGPFEAAAGGYAHELDYFAFMCRI